jgi:hypothetical protein
VAENEQPKHAGGRPSKYDPAFAEQAQKLCELGATDADIAAFFKVSTVTVWRWQNEHAEFCNALKVGKAQADDRVERSLYHRANGYTFDAVKIFQFQGRIIEAPYKEHVPPDTTAMIFWLKNRRPDLWRDKHDVEHTGKDGEPLVPVLNVFTRSADDQPGTSPKAGNGSKLVSH